MAVVNTGAIRKLVTKFLAGRIGREGVTTGLKDLGVNSGNVLRAFTGKNAPVSDQQRLKILRLLTSPDFQAKIGKVPKTGFGQLAGEVRDTSLQERAKKLVANLGQAPAAKGKRTGPKPRREDVEAARKASPKPKTQEEVSEDVLQAVQKKFGIGHLAAVGGIGFGVRGLFTGSAKADSQQRTQNLVTQLLSNQVGVNRQGLVNAQEEKTKLQSALLALKIIEQQKQTSMAQVIPFS